MQNNSEKDAKDGPRPRPRSFVGGSSFEFAYDGHAGGIRPSTRSLDRKEKRPLSLYESLSLDMYAARRNSTSSARPDEHEHEGDHGQAKEFSRLNSKEKAVEVNKERENVQHSLSNEHGEDGLGQRTSSDAADTRKAARQLYAELSSPPLKTVSGDEKFNAVSRLRSLFDQEKSAPPSRNASVPQRNRDLANSSKRADRRSFEDNRKSFEGDREGGSKTRKSEPAKFEFHHRRPKFEKVEAEKKRKLFAPPPPVKLDALLKRESPRSPEEKREWRFRRSSSKENEQPAEKDEKVTEPKQHVEKERKDSKERIEKTSPQKIPERKQSFEIDDIVGRSSTQHPQHHGKQSSVEKDEFTIVHERRRSLPKKRSSSFEFVGLENNIEIIGKKTIDINAMLGLEPPREDPVAEAENEDKEVIESEYKKSVEEDNVVFDSGNEELQKSVDFVRSIEKQNEVEDEDEESCEEIEKEEDLSSKEEVCSDKEAEEKKIEEESEACSDAVNEEDDVVYDDKSKEEDDELCSENFEIDNKFDLPSSEEEFVRIDNLEVKEEGQTVDLDRVEEDLNIDMVVGKNVIRVEDDVIEEELEEEEEDRNEFVMEEDDGHKKKFDDNDNFHSSFVNNLEEAEIDTVVEATTDYKEESIDDNDKNSFEEAVKNEKEQMQLEEEKIDAVEEELVHSSFKFDELAENEAESLATEIIISGEKHTEEIIEETPPNIVVENLVESKENKVIIDEEFISAEEYKQEESEPDFSMLNGEVDDKTNLGYDSFDSFALNVRENGAQNFVDQTISEAIQEVVEKHRVEFSETSDGLMDLSSVEKENVEKEDFISSSEMHDDDLEHKLKVAKALLESEESAVLADEEVKIEKEHYNDEGDDDHGDSDSDHKDTAEDYVSINAPDVDVNVSVEDVNVLHDTVELDDDEYDSDHESALSEGSPHEYTFEENAYDDHDDDHDDDDDHDYDDHDHDDHYHDRSYDEGDVDSENEDETRVADKESESYQGMENQDISEVHEDYDDDDVSSEVIELAPAPSHSCLSARSSSEKEPRKVSFQHSIADVIYTYSPEEYNRGSNGNIDTVTASAEWELEKRVEEKDIFSVDLDKSAGGLGLSIIGLGVSTESGVEKLGIFIKSLTPNGAAHRDRRVQVQDQILEVNGISLVGVTQEFAARTLKNTSGTVRFLMGRDKTKKHYQAPTSNADPVLQELEQKHNLEMSELVSSRQKAEERAAIAEHDLEDIREALLDAEDRLHLTESELEESKEQIDLMKQKQQGKQSERVEELESLVSELTAKLESSEERLSSVQEENEAKIEDLHLKLDEAELNAMEAKKENDHLVLMLQKNAGKLNEAEQNLTLAAKANVDNMNQNQKLKDDNDKLAGELERLKQENRNMMKSLEVKEECLDHVKLIGRLEEQISDLKEDLDLKRQFSDVLVTERDTFKTLVNNLERAQEKLQEAEEKMQIENAVKKMSYENKIHELEETIRELKGADSTDGAPHKKLFPAIERPKVEREIEIKAEASQPLQSKPYFIPPPDYEDEVPEIEAPVKEAVEEAVREKEVPKTEIPGNVPADIVAVEKEAPEKIVIEIEAAVALVEDEPVESAVPEDDVIVETQLVVEQCTPDFSFVEDDEIPVNKVSEDHSNIPNKPEDAVINIVNPIQKPPRRYSDINTATRVKDLPRQEKVVEEQSQEEIIVVADKERSESIRDAFVKLETEDSDRPKQIIEIKRSDTFEVVIKKDPVPEVSRQGEKTLQSEDSFFRDLPESSVDSPDASDNEIRVETQDKEGNDEANVEKVTEVNVMHDIPPISSTSTALIDNPDKSETDEMSKPDLDQPEATDLESKDNETKVNPDRSSFLEALSKNPSFGSWLNGELTVIEQDRKEEQAEEIASKIAEQKERKFSSSSSSSNDSEKEHEDHHHHHHDIKNNNLSTSIRLDESYLKASQPTQEDHDDTDSPLLRLESTDMGPVSEPVMADRPTDRPISVNFDDVVPATIVLENTAQLDKRKLASAISRKSPRRPSTPNVKESLDERPKQNPLPTMQEPSNLSASRENISEEKATNKVVNIDYGGKKDGEKDKRKSIFSFLPKFGGKKKHKRSMENLLAPEESHGHAGTRDSSPARSDRDVEEGVVPFDVKHETDSHSPALQNNQTNVPLAFEVKIVNGDSDSATMVSSGDSHSGTSSLNVSPELSNIAGSTENLAEGVEHEDSPGRLSKENRHSWISRPVNEWDVRQVGLWLIRMDLEAYSQTFQERNVDGTELLNLNGAKLKELGVMHGDDRALIKRKIKEFKLNLDHKSKDSKKDGKSKDKTSKKTFWKGKYTVNQ